MAVLLVASVPLINNCGKLPGGVPGAPSVPGAPGGCPANIADASAIMSTNFGLEGELEGKVKAALAAGADVQAIAVDVEGEVGLRRATVRADADGQGVAPGDRGVKRLQLGQRRSGRRDHSR